MKTAVLLLARTVRHTNCKIKRGTSQCNVPLLIFDGYTDNVETNRRPST